MKEEMETRRFQQGGCLQCGAPLSGITGPKGRTPQKGSIMVCAYCHYVMEWSGESFVELSPEAMKDIENEPSLQEALALTRAFQAQRDITRAFQTQQENSPPVITTNDPQTVIETIRGINPDIKVVVLEPLEPEICEDCGKLEELRPYGLRKENGLRKWVCFACAEKNPEELSRAFDERMEGNNPV